VKGTVTHDMWHLAEFNVARLAAPLDAAEMREFVAFLESLNAYAERSPGFVWRLTGPEGQSSSYLTELFPDPMVIPNLSVWTDLSTLSDFVYQSVHRYFLQQRRRWFNRMEGRTLVLWWHPAGQRPTVEEGQERLALLETRGSSPEAFTFHEAFDPDGSPLLRTASEHQAHGRDGIDATQAAHR
jgi:hypothetical protein